MRLSPKTKEKHIREILTRRIQSGHYGEEGRVESVRQLAKEFNVCIHTANMALSALASQNLVKSTPGRGTFVVSQAKATPVETAIAVLMQMRGHLYSDLAWGVVNHLQQHGQRPVIVDLGTDSGTDNGKIEKVLGAIRASPAGVILDGHSGAFPFGQLVEPLSAIPNVVVVLRNQTQYAFPLVEVITDDEHGTYLGTRHLLELGHRQILVVPAANQLFPIEVTMLKGCQRAFAEFGVKWTPELRFRRDGDETKNWQAYVHLLSTSERPTAMFFFGDFLANTVYSAAREVGLRIPRDLSVVGYYNTPWATAAEVPMTTLSIREAEIGRLAVNSLMERMESSQRTAYRVMVQPELVVRASTASAPR